MATRTHLDPVATRFVTEAPTLVTRIRLGIQCRDADAVARAARHLASLSERVGAAELSRLAADIERAAILRLFDVVHDGIDLGRETVRAVAACHRVAA